MDDDVLGSTIGGYVLGSTIGQGGCGVVYRAMHAERGTPAAVKVMHPDLLVHSDLLVRFQREIEAVQRIRHPGVVEIFDFGSLENGCPYFVMELLTGRTLEQQLHARGRLPADEVLAVLEPLCDALAVAHEQGIVHRDLKPSNVFLCGEPERRRVVLLDFGVAKLCDASGPSLTSSRYVVGTPQFMSPEQFLNKPVDARSDIYGLGCLVYAMLTGAPAFQDSAYFLLRQMHIHRAPERPSARAPVNPAFDEVLLRALSKDPAARQADVGAFLTEVRAAVERALREGVTLGDLGGRRAIGLHIDVTADAEALEAPNERLLVDLESIMPLAMGDLAVAGFTPASITGTSALFTALCRADAHGDAAARRSAVSAAISLYRRILARDGRDPRVAVRLCVHVGEVLAVEGGVLIGGDLLDLSSWVPEEVHVGVYASNAALVGLDWVAQPATLQETMATPMVRVS